MKFKIEEFPNPELIEVHVSKRLADKNHIEFFDMTYALLSKHKEELKDLVRELFQIEGVTSINVNQYSIRIHKGLCFEWEEIVPAIISALDIMLATNEDLEELERITLTTEERSRKLAEAEEFFRTNRGGGFMEF